MHRAGQAPGGARDGDNRWHELTRRHNAHIPESPGDNSHPGPYTRPHGEGSGRDGPVQDPRPRRGRQAPVAGLQRHVRHGHQEFTPRETDPAVLGHIPADRGAVHEEALTGPLRDQSHGGADIERCHAVLRVCPGETESALFKYSIFKGRSARLFWFFCA